MVLAPPPPLSRVLRLLLAEGRRSQVVMPAQAAPRLRRLLLLQPRLHKARAWSAADAGHAAPKVVGPADADADDGSPTPRAAGREGRGACRAPRRYVDVFESAVEPN